MNERNSRIRMGKAALGAVAIACLILGLAAACMERTGDTEKAGQTEMPAVSARYHVYDPSAPELMPPLPAGSQPAPAPIPNPGPGLMPGLVPDPGHAVLSRRVPDQGRTFFRRI